MNMSQANWVENGKHCKMMYMADCNTVYEKWSGFTQGEELRKAWMNVHEFFKKSGAKRMVFDVKEAKTFPIQDREWYFREVFPKDTAAGIEAIAIVESDSATNRMGIKSSSRKVSNSPIKVEFFSTGQEAIDWIKLNL